MLSCPPPLFVYYIGGNCGYFDGYKAKNNNSLVIVIVLCVCVLQGGRRLRGLYAQKHVCRHILIGLESPRDPV